MITFDIAAAEEYVDGYLTDNALSGPIESQRAWLLIAKLLGALDVTDEQKDWVLGLIVKSEQAQMWQGWHQGYKAGFEVAEEVTA